MKNISSISNKEFLLLLVDELGLCKEEYKKGEMENLSAYTPKGMVTDDGVKYTIRISDHIGKPKQFRTEISLSIVIDINNNITIGVSESDKYEEVVYSSGCFEDKETIIATLKEILIGISYFVKTKKYHLGSQGKINVKNKRVGDIQQQYSSANTSLNQVARILFVAYSFAI